MTPSDRRRGLALAVLCAATLMIILDGTIVTVALPSIQRDLRVPATSLSWVMNAYLITFGGLLLLAGRLGDLLGRKRMFLAGLTVFATASLACGLATGPAMLIAARALQGAGGAMVAAVSLGMVTALYPEPSEQAKAVAVYSFTGAVGASAGLVLGGVLTQVVSWQAIFFVNLPIAAAAGVPAVRLLRPEQGAGLRAGADGLGAFLATGGLMLGVGTLVETVHDGWLSARTICLGVTAVVLLGAFVIRQATAAVPLLPLRIFSSREVSAANLAQFLVIAAAFGFQVLIALYMQDVLGYRPAGAGLGLLPTAAVIGAVALGFSARLAGRFGARAVLLAGLTLIAAALAMLSRAPVHGSYPAHLLPVMLIFGAGGGLTLPALAMLGMSGATAADAGVISGVFNTTQQVGAAFGVAVLTTLAASRTLRLVAVGRTARDALAGGYHLAFGIGAGLALAAVTVTVALLRSRRPESAPRGGERRTAPPLAPDAKAPDAEPAAAPCGAGR